MKLRKILFFLASLLLLVNSIFVPSAVNAQTAPTDTPTPTPTGTQSSNSDAYNYLVQQINDLTNKINDLQGQEKSLASDIEVMDSQIKLTEYRIQATQDQMLSLEEDIDTAQNKITNLEGSLNNLTKIMANRVVAGYEVGSEDPFQLLIASNSISDFFKRSSYLTIVERHDKQLVYDTVQAKNDYANQKQIYEDKKKKVIALQQQLQAYTTQLDSEKSAKQDLLTQTQGSEANYRRLLVQTQAQLASFQGFVAAQGGASLLSNQTVCDGWGCYYNQRDSQWGGLALNNTSYSIAEVGCLMTAMAMVYTHYGHKDVTPLSINSLSSNFSGIPPALLNRHIVANGTSSYRNGNETGNVISDIDSILNSNNPAIVGIQYSSGNTHFVVIVSGSNGNYTMNDPYVENGHNISFTDHYSLGMVYEVDKVTF